jgi:hypothetical protein
MCEERALILDKLEEFEERLSRIENCMIDLGFVLRSFKSESMLPSR